MGSRNYSKKSKDSIVAAFKKYDTDHNGSISLDELFKVMSEFRGNLTLEETKQLIAKIDKDNSGTVNIAGECFLFLFKLYIR